jgi:transglutaminase-like putative cysteine protease
MRIHIAHSSVYRYEPPAMGVIQVLRLTPRNHEGQYLVGWRIDVTPDARLAAHEDAFGNITHVFTADGPLEELRVEVDGQVETQNTDGVVRGTVERFPPSLFLRDTALTQADDAIRQFAEQVRAARGDTVLAQLHGLLDRLYEEVGETSSAKQTADQDGQSQAQAGRGSANATGSAAKAFALKRGTPEDLTHIVIGAAHCLGIPARYVGGYFRPAATDGVQHTSHAWAEAHVADLGWVGFDPWNGFCPTDAHVRVAIGLDSLGAAPMRGTRLGAGAETLAVAIKVDQ